MTSALEKVLEELPGFEPPFSFPGSPDPFLASGWSSIANCAVEMLNEEEEIKEFFGQYITYIQENSELDIVEATKSANEIIGYSTGYVND